MSRKAQADVIVKLIVGAGQAAPTPPVGPALGSKGVKSMDFCKEFNARTAHYVPGTPIPSRITVRPDRSFHFTLRTPTTAMLLLSAAGVTPSKNKLKGAGNTVGARQLAQMVSGAYQSTAVATPGAGGEGAQDQASVPAGSPANVSSPEPNYDHVLSTRGKQTKDQKAGNAVLGTVGKPISLKHVYEIAKVKHVDMGGELRAVAASVVAQAGSMGVVIVP